MIKPEPCNLAESIPLQTDRRCQNHSSSCSDLHMGCNENSHILQTYINLMLREMYTFRPSYGNFDCPSYILCARLAASILKSICLGNLVRMDWGTELIDPYCTIQNNIVLLYIYIYIYSHCIICTILLIIYIHIQLHTTYAYIIQCIHYTEYTLHRILICIVYTVRLPKGILAVLHIYSRYGPEVWAVAQS